MGDKTWHKLTRKLPEDGQQVVWMNSNGDEVHGKFRRGMWFLDGPKPMYIYYLPQVWREA